MDNKAAARAAAQVDENQLSEADQTETDPDKGLFVYEKKKNVKIYITPKKNLIVEVRHEDGRHELNLAVTFSQQNLNIIDVQCKMEKYPHKECIQAASALRDMIGKKVQSGLMNGLKEVIGNKGCTHLNNLFQEACYSVVQGQGALGRLELGKLFQGITNEQIYKIFLMFKPEMIDSCVAYASGADLMQTLEKTTLPPGAERLKPPK